MSDKQIQYVAYRRVSTKGQEVSGLGLEAQESEIAGFIERDGGTLIGQFTETESGKKTNRVELDLALAMCRKHKATLLIAKLDRLSRDVEFLFRIKNSGQEIKALDMPYASTLEFGIKAIFAQHERELISQRTIAGLKAAKARGVELGRNGKVLAERAKAEAMVRAKSLRPILTELRQDGITTARAIADALNDREVETPRGGRWHQSSVSNVLKRLAA